ncbi:MAG TPA: hypothetical protein VJR29_02670 [bacterium]|nr:hypothetical protein [bacterium]
MAARSDDAGRLFDIFLVTSIGTILGVRAFLWLTGYPQIGGGHLHIAHMLWGGLLMMAALLLMQSVLVRWARHTGAWIGGIGFGLFIDELGKFITKDNDYFYQPTFAILYLLFVMIYLVAHSWIHNQGLAPQESLINAVDYLKEGVWRKLEPGEKARAMRLAAADPSHPLAGPIEGMLDRIDEGEARGPSRWERCRDWARRNYLRLVHWKGFATSLVVLLCGSALIDILEYRHRLPLLWSNPEGLNFGERAGMLSGFASALLVLAGAIPAFSGRRLLAYRLFEKALLLSLFVNQVFVFARVQALGIFDFVFTLLLLLSVRLLIQEEEAVLEEEAAKAPPRHRGGP